MKLTLMGINYMTISRVLKGIFGIQDLTKIKSGIRKNTKFLDGIHHLTAGHEVGFAKMLAWDVVLGEETVFRIKMTEVQDVGFSQESRCK